MKLRIGFFSGLAVAAVVVAVLVAPVPAAKAADFVPAPPAGWHITQVTPPAWTQEFLLKEGVLVASTELFDAAGLQAHYDVYQLQGSNQANPVATVLRDALDGAVWSLDDGVVLYSKIRPGTNPNDQFYDLYVRDLGSGAMTKIPIPAGVSLYPGTPPQVDDGRVVWSQFGFQHQAEVMLYDVATGKLQSLTPDPVDSNESPWISGDDVVWQVWDGQTCRILHYDLKTGETEQLAGGIPWTPSLGLQVDNGKVIWVTREWVTPLVAKSSLFLRDLSTGSTQLLATATGQFEDLEATLSGNLLASLISSDGEDFELSARNLSTGSSRSLAEFHAQPLSYSVADGMVAWQDSTELPAGQGYLGKILVYDDATGKVTQLAESVGLGRPIVDRGRVLFFQTIDSMTSALWLAQTDDPEPYDYYLDLEKSDPYREAILDFAGKGYVSGYETGTFRTIHPAGPLLRAQLAKILVNALGLPVDASMSSSFKDLGPDSSHFYPDEYVAAATKAGLLAGYSPTEFGPWNQLTRAQMVTVLVRAAQKLSPSALTSPPSDYVGSVTGGPEAHAGNLRIAEYNGLLRNLADFGSSWDPNSYARRGEVVQLLFDLKKLTGG